MYEDLKFQFKFYDRNHKKLTNREVVIFADWVSTEIFRDELNNINDYNYWRNCKKEVGDGETLVCYFNSCKFVMQNSLKFAYQKGFSSIDEYCIDVLAFINAEFGTLPLYYRYPTYEMISGLYFKKGHYRDSLSYSLEGINLINNCKMLSGNNDPFNEIKFLGYGELTMLESLYQRNFHIYHLLYQSNNAIFIDEAARELGNLLFEVSNRGGKINQFDNVKDRVIQELRYEKNYTDDKIAKIFFSGR